MKNPTVDIIIPIHNAPHLTELCLNSVATTLNPGKHRLILINDGSELETTEVVNVFAKKHQGTVVLQNPHAEGFTKSANKGLRESSAQMAIILNSDTQVTSGWIEKLAATLFGTNGVGIVGPLSNAASYQSIPRTEPNPTEVLNRQTVINEIPPGFTIQTVNNYLESIKWGSAVRVPLIHGFCFALRAEVISEVGYFDDIAFPRGFGEETDFCFRATDAGWGLAISPDTYVWHEKTGSYSLDTRARLTKIARSALLSKYGKKRIETAKGSLRSTAEYLQSRIGEFSYEY